MYAAVQQAYLFIPLQMQVLLLRLIELNGTSQLHSILASFVDLFYLHHNTARLPLATYCSKTSCHLQSQITAILSQDRHPYAGI